MRIKINNVSNKLPVLKSIILEIGYIFKDVIILDNTNDIATFDCITSDYVDSRDEVEETYILMEKLVEQDFKVELIK